jgi:hypothetical protein
VFSEEELAQLRGFPEIGRGDLMAAVRVPGAARGPPALPAGAVFVPADKG